MYIYICMYILNVNCVRTKQNTLGGFMFVTSNIHTYMHKCKKRLERSIPNFNHLIFPFHLFIF